MRDRNEEKGRMEKLGIERREGEGKRGRDRKGERRRIEGGIER